MRNIQQLTDVQVRIQDGGVPEPSVFCVSHSTGLVYRLSAAGELSCLHPGTSRKEWHIALPAPAENAAWSFIDFSDQLGGVLCGSSCGQLVVVTVEDQQLEEIGEFDGGIMDIQWAADGEMFAILCGSGSLLVMTPRWQVLSEVTLPEPLDGSAGKLAWRPDAQYIAVSTQDAESGDRIVRVLTNDLNLHSEGRNEDNSGVPDLYPVLAWSTDNELIGSVQRVREHMQVVFFERNGLRHGEFTLPDVDPAKSVPASLQWNSSCDLLAVHLAAVPSTPDAATSDESLEKMEEATRAAHVQLWYRDNYHWSCKLQLHEGGQDEPRGAPTIGCMQWDSEVTFRLRYTVHASHIRQMDFDLSSMTSGGPCTLATNVQGTSIGLTPLAYMLTPPPSCYVKLRLPSPAVCASYEPLAASGCGDTLLPALPDRESTPCHTAGEGDAGGIDSMLQQEVLPVTGDNRLAVITADGTLRVMCSAVVPPRHPLARGGCGILQPSDAKSSAAVPCNAQGQAQAPTHGVAQRAGLCDVPLAGIMAASGNGHSLPDTPLDSLHVRQLTWVTAKLPQNAIVDDFEYHFVALAAAPAPNVGDWLLHLAVRIPADGPPTLRATVFPVPLGFTSISEGCAAAHANGTVVRMAAAAGGDTAAAAALVHTTDCAVWRWTLQGDSGNWEHVPHCVLPEVCTHIAALRPTVGADTGPAPMLALNSLSSRLYLNHVLLCPAATSMALHWMPGKGVQGGAPRTAQFLFYTTLGPTPSLACVSEHTLHLLLQAAPAPALPSSASADDTAEDGPTTVLRAEGAAPPPVPVAGAPAPDAPPQISAEVGAEVSAAGAWDSSAARTVERGALLVAVTPGGTRVVLQMPRGNFEGTHPRVLTLTMVRHLMDTRQYGAAVEVCRRHRIDMALLAAHDEAAFVAWAPVAITQLAPTAHDRWDLMLTALGSDEAAVRAKYPPPPGYMKPPSDPPSQVHVEAWQVALQQQLSCAPRLPAAQGGTWSHATRVCCAVRAAITSLYPAIASSAPAPLLKTLLTSYAKQDPADVGTALAVVQEVSRIEAGGSAAAQVASEGGVLASWTPPHTPRLPARAALKHLALLVTPDELWDAALRTYDLALMQLVADATGRDPKKTEPFLRRLVALARVHSSHACYAVAAELKDAHTAMKWSAAAAVKGVQGGSLEDQWACVASAMLTLCPGSAQDAAETAAALSAAHASLAEWSLRLDTLLPQSLPSEAAVTRAWRLEGDAAAVDEALTAPFTSLVAWGFKGGFTAAAVDSVPSDSHPLLRRALQLLAAMQKREAAAAALQASTGTHGAASRNAALPPQAVEHMQKAALQGLKMDPPCIPFLLETAKHAPMLTLSAQPAVDEGSDTLVAQVHAAATAVTSALPNLVQSQAEQEEAKEEQTGGFGDAWGADDDDFAEDDDSAAQSVASEGGLPGILPPLAAVRQELWGALCAEFTARSAQYSDSAVMHGLMPPPNAPQDGSVSHPVLHRPQAHAALFAAARLVSGQGAEAEVAALFGLSHSDLLQLQPRMQAVTAGSQALPSVDVHVPVTPTPPLVAAVQACKGDAMPLLGVAVPALLAACSSWNKAWAQRLESVPRHMAALATVRQLRASVSVADLIGVSGASAAAAHGAGGDVGDTGSVWDDGASVWSEASSVAGSVWSSASGASLASASSRGSARSAVTDASELLSVGSAASARTAGTSRTDGLFSHVPSREFTSITFDRRTGGFDSAAEAKKAQRHAVRRAKKASGRAGRKDRGRVGSDRNQRAKESALLDALPDARWRLDTAEVCDALQLALTALAQLAASEAVQDAARALETALDALHATQEQNMAALAAMPGPIIRVPVPGVTRDSEHLAHRADVGGHTPHTAEQLYVFTAEHVVNALQKNSAAVGVSLAQHQLLSPHASDVDAALAAAGVQLQPLPDSHELASSTGTSPVV